MYPKKPFNSKIWYEMKMALNELYPKEEQDSRCKKVKAKLIKKYPGHRKFIESLKCRLIVQVLIPA